MITPSISTLQAMAGRHLSSSSDPLAWEATSQRRCTDLVRAFQRKDLDPDGLRAALMGERLGTPPPPSPSSVAILALSGVLMPSASIFSFLGFGTSMQTFTRQLIAATFDRNVKAIAIVVDSPGGSIRAIREAALAMRAARGHKPVIATVAGLCASAAYWVCSNASVIEATPSASIGAIGVLTERVSLTRHLQQQGIDVAVIAAGKYKGENHPATPLGDAELKAIQQRVDAAYSMFVDDVGAGRHVSAGVVRGGFGEGRLVDAPDALRLNMVDAVATVDATIARVLGAPAAFTTTMTARVESSIGAFERDRRESARAEIDGFRARIHRSAMR